MSKGIEVVKGGEAIVDPRVRALDYIGGEGGFCEPLVINQEGEERYVLYQMYLCREPGRWDASDWLRKHRKIEYGSQEELEAGFDEVQRRLTADCPSLDWLETDASLGFDIPADKFAEATSSIRAIPWDQRRN